MCLRIKSNILIIATQQKWFIMLENDFCIVIQARTGSLRLPNKVINPFYDEQSILEIIINKLLKLNVKVVVATTESGQDKVVEDVETDYNNIMD